jgi:hypothetical protein
VVQPVLVDTNAAMALVVTDHEDHDRTFTVLSGRVLGLCGHAAFETFSVLTRLPGAQRLSPPAARRLLDANFPETPAQCRGGAAAAGRPGRAPHRRRGRLRRVGGSCRSRARHATRQPRPASSRHLRAARRPTGTPRLTLSNPPGRNGHGRHRLWRAASDPRGLLLARQRPASSGRRPGTPGGGGRLANPAL